MTRAEIYQRITGILVKTFELDPADIRPESRLYEDLDLDSIDAVDMFVELHEVTGRRIDPQAARNIRTGHDGHPQPTDCRPRGHPPRSRQHRRV